jgi:hypothetical protein
VSRATKAVLGTDLSLAPWFILSHATARIRGLAPHSHVVSALGARSVSAQFRRVPGAGRGSVGEGEGSVRAPLGTPPPLNDGNPGGAPRERTALRATVSTQARIARVVLKLPPPRPTILVVDPIAATSGTSANVPATTNTKATGKTKAELTAFEDRLKAAGAKLEKVEGHAYEQVTGGKHDGQQLNISGNERSGQLFELVQRNGKTFHVYGSGSHRLFIGMPSKPAGNGGTKAS